MAFVFKTDFVFTLVSVKMLIVGLAVMIFAAYVSLKTPEQLQRHPRLSKLKDRHIGEYFASGIFATALSAMFLVKAWFDSGEQKTELETGLTIGLVLVAILAVAAVILLRIVSKLRD